MVLDVLRAFGTPAEIAARYRPSSGMLIIPAGHTRSFAIVSIIGIALQWALTLPWVFDGRMAIGGWWLTWGLGACWWPGFQAMMTLLIAWFRSRGLFVPKWSPRIADPDRIDQSHVAPTLVGFVFMTIIMAAVLLWMGVPMPDPGSGSGFDPEGVLALDPEFLRARTWPLWFVFVPLMVTMFWTGLNGRWTTLMHRLNFSINLVFAAMLVWWLYADNIFIEQATNDIARTMLAVFTAYSIIWATLVFYHGRMRIKAPQITRKRSARHR